ncbi:MAG: Gfo/Idh/MocA family oxidoreductase [Sediminibacterium sp.]|nr:Gfo/Idh/MocA family oxidoreductase [Sediminibacterium sp.]
MKSMSRRKFVGNLSALSTAIGLNSSVTSAQNKPIIEPSKPPFNRPVKVAIIGCGVVMNCCYTPNLQASKFAEIVSVCDIKPERAKEAAKKFNIPNWYPNLEKMLAGPPFDLLVNLTDMQEHERLNKQALEAKRYVWSEKPMANSFQAGKNLLDIAIAQGVFIWGAPAVVQSPAFEFMAQQIQQKKLGRVAAANAHYGHQGPSWSAFFYEQGGGSLPDLGVYNIASLTGILGPVKSVVAMTNIITPTRKVDDKGFIQVRAEDNAQLILEHDQENVLSHIQCGFNYFDPYGHEGKGQSNPTISIVGSSGSMHLIGYDWHPVRVEISTQEQEKQAPFEYPENLFQWQMGASVICEYLSTGKKTRIHPEHALHVLEIIEAARKSQESGQRIYLQSAFNWPMV